MVWLSERSVHYPITKPREPGRGKKMHSPQPFLLPTFYFPLLHVYFLAYKVPTLELDGKWLSHPRNIFKISVLVFLC